MSEFTTYKQNIVQKTFCNLIKFAETQVRSVLRHIKTNKFYKNLSFDDQRLLTGALKRIKSKHNLINMQPSLFGDIAIY